MGLYIYTVSARSKNTKYSNQNIIVTREVPQSRVVLFTVTMLYIMVITQLGLQWFIVKKAFVNNGESRESIFLSYPDEPWWFILVSDICLYLASVLADVLLVRKTIPHCYPDLQGQIWRCFHIWNRSIRVISLPLILLLAEIGEVPPEICEYLQLIVKKGHICIR